MRIACLQFAPQVGDVDNNLNRADSVLARADQDDVDSLDLLVLPELAFSGMQSCSNSRVVGTMSSERTGSVSDRMRGPLHHQVLTRLHS